MGSSLNQRTAEFSLCNTLVLLLDLAFKQYSHDSNFPSSVARRRNGLRYGMVVTPKTLCPSAQLAHWPDITK